MIMVCCCASKTDTNDIDLWIFLIVSIDFEVIGVDIYLYTCNIKQQSLLSHTRFDLLGLRCRRALSVNFSHINASKKKKRLPFNSNISEIMITTSS